MSTKQDQDKPINRCHNPAGCDNECRPGYNFCDSCRKSYGMTKKPKDWSARAIKYKYPLIQVGEAAQTHLQQQEETKTMTEPLGGKTAQQITSQRKSDSLKKMYANNPRVGIFFDGWLKDWIEASAAERGMTLQQYIIDLIMERIPDDVVAAGARADIRRKG